MKIFCTLIFFVILFGCILFGLPYVGVDLAIIIVPAFILLTVLAYVLRPKEIKTIQKNISDTTRECVSSINETISEMNSERELSKILDKKQQEKEKEKLIQLLSEEEYTAIVARGVNINKYILLKKLAKEKHINFSVEDLIDCALKK